MFATGLMLPGARPPPAAASRGAPVSRPACSTRPARCCSSPSAARCRFLLALGTWRIPGRAPRTPALAAVLAALAAVRPTACVVIAEVLTTMAVRGRRWPWREASWPRPCWCRFSPWRGAYGAPLPSTLPARLAQRTRLVGHVRARPVDWLRLFLWDPTRPNLGFAPVTPPTLWLWIAAGVVAIWRLQPLLPLLAWAVAFTAAYALLRVPFYHWYAAPAALGLYILAGAGLARAVEWLVSTGVIRRMPCDRRC